MATVKLLVLDEVGQQHVRLLGAALFHFGTNINKALISVAIFPDKLYQLGRQTKIKTNRKRLTSASLFGHLLCASVGRLHTNGSSRWDHLRRLFRLCVVMAFSIYTCSRLTRVVLLLLFPLHPIHSFMGLCLSQPGSAKFFQNCFSLLFNVLHRPPALFYDTFYEYSSIIHVELSALA